jgi:hypothetical protein
MKVLYYIDFGGKKFTIVEMRNWRERLQERSNAAIARSWFGDRVREIEADIKAQEDGTRRAGYGEPTLDVLKTELSVYRILSRGEHADLPMEPDDSGLTLSLAGANILRELAVRGPLFQLTPSQGGAEHLIPLGRQTKFPGISVKYTFETGVDYITQMPIAKVRKVTVINAPQG